VAVVVDVEEEEEEEEEEGSRGSSDGRRGGISVGRVVLNVVVLLLVVPEAEAVSCVGLEAETVVVVVVVVVVDGGGEAAAVVFSTPNSFRKCDLSCSNSLPLGCCFRGEPAVSDFETSDGFEANGFDVAALWWFT
jgi:hypothetical protein